MLVSVLSACVVGVWLCVGSSTTWCHSVCVVCDPVVTSGGQLFAMASSSLLGIVDEGLSLSLPDFLSCM